MMIPANVDISYVSLTTIINVYRINVDRVLVIVLAQPLRVVVKLMVGLMLTWM